ncbi:hypothetical protein [Desertibacillus haloalkaliphilus]|uniref:hypothetical protein n=1 Tax=Desertibacillus haloalkaliphilus TaxID=1328930 RepID=UPI001C273D8E|nr:hypothetical protein [Desertibacillus haloalkaliphilus]MBU8908168.1 hypothetical protein [Desertibacillus haloalkaliphilus]
MYILVSDLIAMVAITFYYILEWYWIEINLKAYYEKDSKKETKLTDAVGYDRELIGKLSYLPDGSIDASSYNDHFHTVVEPNFMSESREKHVEHSSIEEGTGADQLLSDLQNDLMEDSESVDRKEQEHGYVVLSETIEDDELLDELLNEEMSGEEKSHDLSGLPTSSVSETKQLILDKDVSIDQGDKVGRTGQVERDIEEEDTSFFYIYEEDILDESESENEERWAPLPADLVDHFSTAYVADSKQGNQRWFGRVIGKQGHHIHFVDESQRVWIEIGKYKVDRLQIDSLIGLDVTRDGDEIIAKNLVVVEDKEMGLMKASSE